MNYRDNDALRFSRVRKHYYSGRYGENDVIFTFSVRYRILFNKNYSITSGWGNVPYAPPYGCPLPSMILTLIVALPALLLVTANVTSIS